MVKYYYLSEATKISKSCDRTQPCRHLVLKTGQPPSWLYGMEIYEMCLNENIRPPEHFRHFVDHLRYPGVKKSSLLCSVL